MTNEKDTVAWRNIVKEVTEQLASYPNNLQNIHTPFDLCNCIISKLKEQGEFENKTFCTLNLEFVDVLCYDYGVSRDKIYFVSDCKEKIAIAKSSRYNGVNTVEGDFLKWETDMKQFDNIVMNPPYQAPKEKLQEGGGKSGTSLWDKFVEKALNIVKEDGYLCTIHPSRWRKPNNKTGQKIRAKQLQYLEIHDEKDGIKTFGAETRYDWYILKNKNYAQKTIIKGQDGKISKVNLADIPFIPNNMIDEVLSLFAKNETERIKIIHSFSTYETRAEWMSKTKTETNIYPCVYTVTSVGEPTLFYSSTKEKGHFGIPKLIFSSGRISSANYIVDTEGQYGLTQFAKGIIDTPENLNNIYKAMRTDRFKRIMEACAISLLEIDKDILSLFKKDFWKEFV